MANGESATPAAAGRRPKPALVAMAEVAAGVAVWAAAWVVEAKAVVAMAAAARAGGAPASPPSEGAVPADGEEPKAKHAMVAPAPPPPPTPKGEGCAPAPAGRKAIPALKAPAPPLPLPTVEGEGAAPAPAGREAIPALKAAAPPLPPMVDAPAEGEAPKDRPERGPVGRTLGKVTPSRA